MKVTTQDELWAVSPIYCLLKFEKDDFCKLIDAIGLEKWEDAKGRWERLSRAEEELNARERYQKEKCRLADLEQELETLRDRTAQYESTHRL